jgi:hypothetical protein
MSHHIAFNSHPCHLTYYQDLVYSTPDLKYAASKGRKLEKRGREGQEGGERGEYRGEHNHNIIHPSLGAQRLMNSKIPVLPSNCRIRRNRLPLPKLKLLKLKNGRREPKTVPKPTRLKKRQPRLNARRRKRHDYLLKRRPVYLQSRLPREGRRSLGTRRRTCDLLDRERSPLGADWEVQRRGAGARHQMLRRQALSPNPRSISRRPGWTICWKLWRSSMPRGTRRTSVLKLV